MRVIGGRWRGRTLAPFDGQGIRPTPDRVREAWMSAMGGRFDGLDVLDLFAGSGALGIECLSRGAARVIFVDSDPASIEVVRANLARVGAESGRYTVIDAELPGWLEEGEATPVDLALADPPYDRGLAPLLVELFERRPFARELWLEHRSGERIRSPRLTRSRRYGGTTLSTLGAAP